MCSRKDYEALAKAIRFAKPETIEEDASTKLTREIIADHMARHFQIDNPRFDRERFLNACGVK